MELSCTYLHNNVKHDNLLTVVRSDHIKTNKYSWYINKMIINFACFVVILFFSYFTYFCLISRVSYSYIALTTNNQATIRQMLFTFSVWFNLTNEWRKIKEYNNNKKVHYCKVIAFLCKKKLFFLIPHVKDDCWSISLYYECEYRRQTFSDSACITSRNTTR